MDLRSAAFALDGIVTGRNVLCPGPGHSRDDRSLSVRFDARAPDGFLVHSFSGDDDLACKDYVRNRLGLCRASLPWQPFSANFRKFQPAPIDGRSRTEAACRIWHEAHPSVGSPVEAYLKGRGLELVPELAELRYHPRCPFKGENVGASIAPMTDGVTGEFRGVHRTRLNPREKAMLGPSKGTVVRLSPDEEVTDGLHICEGIETGLALLAMGMRPLWCCLSANGIAGLPVLGGIEALTIFTDNDASGTGERVAVKCAQRWQTAGREVRVLMAPSVGTDFADYGRVS